MERKLRRVGGSVMLPIPPELLADSGLAVGQAVRMRSRAGRLEIEAIGQVDADVAAFTARFIRRYHKALERLAEP
jgi:hypothetical protein